MSKVKEDEYLDTFLNDRDPADEYLDKLFDRINQISLSTHVSKFTHADNSVAMNALYHPKECQLGLISSDVIIKDDVDYDFSGNSGVMDAAKMLNKTTAKGDLLINELLCDDFSSLKKYSNNAKQLSSWRNKFNAWSTAKGVESGNNSKQLLFPISDNFNEYHVISPLFPSSLYNKIHNMIKESKFDKKTRDLRRASLGSSKEVIYHKDIADVGHNRGKAGIRSYLNSKRGGSTFLLNCSPPSNSNAPYYNLSSRFSFWNTYSYMDGISESLDHISSMTIDSDDFHEAIDLIIDQWVQLVYSIRLNKQPSWTDESEIKPEEKYLLDSGYNEEPNERWMKDIADSYALWLNNALNKRIKSIHFGEEHAILWSSKIIELKLTGARHE